MQSDLIVRLLQLVALSVSLAGLCMSVGGITAYGTELAGCGFAAAVILEGVRSGLH